MRTSPASLVVGGVVIVTAACLGSVHLPFRITYIAACGALFVLLVWVRRAERWPRSIELTLAFAALIIGGLSLLPLPSIILRFVSPETWQWTYGSLPAAGIDPTLLRPAAVAPGRTGLAVATGAAHLLLLLSAAVVARRGAAAVRLVGGVLVMGGFALGLLAILLDLAGFERTYGTFINGNHSGAFLAALAVLGFGQAITASDMRWRGAATFAGGVAAVAAVWSHSRGAVLVLGVGIAILIGLALLRPRESVKRLTESSRLQTAQRAGLIVLLLAVAGLYFFWLGPVSVAREVSTLSRLDLPTDYRTLVWRDSLELLRSFWLLGTGPGGFASAFPTVRTFSAPVWAQSAESEVIQALVEVGLVGALALAGTWIVVLVNGVLRIRKGEVSLIGPLAALCVLGAHATFDFPLHTTAVAALAAVCAGLIVGRLPRPESSRVWQAGALLLAVALTGVSVGVVLHPTSRMDTSHLQRRLWWDPGRYRDYVRLAEHGVHPVELTALAVSRNPTEPFTHEAYTRALAAAGHMQRAEQAAAATLERLDERGRANGPTRASLEVLVGDGYLWGPQSDPDSARVHYRRAVENDPEDGDAWLGLGDVAYLQEQPDDARAHWTRAVDAGVPAGRIDSRVLGAAANALAAGESAEARSWIGQRARRSVDLAAWADAVRSNEALAAFGDRIPLWDGPQGLDVPVITRKQDFPTWQIPVRISLQRVTLVLTVQSPRRPGEQAFAVSGGQRYYGGTVQPLGNRRYEITLSSLHGRLTRKGDGVVTALGYDTRGIEGRHVVEKVEVVPEF